MEPATTSHKRGASDATSHKRGASDATTRSERKAEHEQERPARRAVGAQELAGLGIKAAQEDGEGTQGGEGAQGRPRRIGVPSKIAPSERTRELV